MHNNLSDQHMNAVNSISAYLKSEEQKSFGEITPNINLVIPANSILKEATEDANRQEDAVDESARQRAIEIYFN